MQRHAQTRRRPGAGDFALHDALDVDLHAAHSWFAMQRCFVEGLHAALADEFRGAVAAQVQFGQIVLRDAPHRTDGVRHQLAQGIAAHRLRLDVHPAQAVSVDLDDGPFALLDVALHRHRRQAVAFAGPALAEGRGLGWREGHQRRHVGQLGIDVGSPLRHHDDGVDGAVVRQQLAVAVVDQASGRRQRDALEAVLVGERSVLVVLGHHQPGEAEDQQEEEQRQEDDENDRTRHERRLLPVRVLHARLRVHGQQHGEPPRR